MRDQRKKKLVPILRHALKTVQKGMDWELRDRKQGFVGIEASASRRLKGVQVVEEVSWRQLLTRPRDHLRRIWRTGVVLCVTGPFGSWYLFRSPGAPALDPTSGGTPEETALGYLFNIKTVAGERGNHKVIERLAARAWAFIDRGGDDLRPFLTNVNPLRPDRY